MNLPLNISPTDFHKVFRPDFSKWKSTIEEICENHQIGVSNIEPFLFGSNLVAAVSEDAIVKVFPPFHEHQWESERTALRHLTDHDIGVDFPRIHAEGKLPHGWHYLILSKVAGESLEAVWPALSMREKSDLMHEIGQLMARVHDIPIQCIQHLAPEWNSFLENQKVNCVSRHRRFNMPAWFLDEVTAFTEKWMHDIPKANFVLLTGEYTPFNLLVSRTDGMWTISGMIDFGDAMIGPREYDFVGPAFFLAEGNAELLHRLFRGYASSYIEWNENLLNQVMVLGILHRYSNLKFQIRIDGWEQRAHSIDDLVEMVLPLFESTDNRSE